MSTKKLIGRIPISKGEYVAGQSYNRLSQVTLYGSTYQSKADGNTSAPAFLDSDGNVHHANTDLWLVVADGSSAYNAGERTSCFSLQESDEFLSVETDAEGKVISSTNSDGSHYARNMRSETIPEELSHIEDPEKRMQITTDAEKKILSYRDSGGTLHEYRMKVKHLILTDDAAKEVGEAFKTAGIKMENPSDFSKESHIELPIPRIAAQVKIYASSLPTTKTDNIDAYVEYNDKDGNYFRKPVILNAQGNSSLAYYVKNLAIDINDESDIKFGDFPSQDSFHLKKYYIDVFRGQCVVAYHLMEQVYKSRSFGQQYPYEYITTNDSVTNGVGDFKKDFFTGAKCHPDGFPIIVTFIDINTGIGTEMGIYTWNLKKSKEVYACEKKETKHIILDGSLNINTLFGGAISWNAFEIRNPKSLKTINETKYDGDNPMELSDSDAYSKKVKSYIKRLAEKCSILNASHNDDERREVMDEFLLLNPTIDYFLVSQLLYHHDGFDKNWIWVTWDGEKWCPTLYDADSIFGQYWNGTFVIENSSNEGILVNYPLQYLPSVYKDKMEERYKYLRENNIFSSNNVISLLNDWMSRVGFDNYSKEISIYQETPSYRASNINAEWEFVRYSGTNDYDAGKIYDTGEKCSFNGYEFKASKTMQGIPPVNKTYGNSPTTLGFYNSTKRIKKWLDNRISFLDKTYNYINL